VQRGARKNRCVVLRNLRQLQGILGIDLNNESSFRSEKVLNFAQFRLTKLLLDTFFCKFPNTNYSNHHALCLEILCDELSITTRFVMAAAELTQTSWPIKRNACWRFFNLTELLTACDHFYWWSFEACLVVEI